MKRFALIAALLFALALHADDKLCNPEFSRGQGGQRQAHPQRSIVLHPLAKDGKQEYAGYELKTDPDGKASFDGAPFGKLRVQVLVRGFQTYGDDFDINQPTQEITIKLKRPQHQYSIYDDKPKQDGKKPEEKPK